MYQFLWQEVDNKDKPLQHVHSPLETSKIVCCKGDYSFVYLFNLFWAQEY